MNKMKYYFYLIRKYPYNELANILGKFSFMKLYFKYYVYVLILEDSKDIDVFLENLSNLDGTKEERFLEAAKRRMVNYSSDNFYYMDTKFLKLETINLNDNIYNLRSCSVHEVFPQYIQKAMYTFGIDNILKFEEETKFFSDYNTFDTDAFHKGSINFYHFASLIKKLKLDYKISSYEEFLVCFCDALKIMKDNGYVFDISSLKEKLESYCPELFIDSKAPLKLKELFYMNILSSKEIFNHEEYIPYLISKDLNKLFPCLIKVKTNDNIFDLVNLVSKEIYLKILSKYLITEEIIINLENEEELNKIEYFIRETLYKKGENIDYLFIREDFLKEHPELKIDINDKKIKKILNKRKLTLDDVRIYSNVGEALRGKDLVRLFNLNEYLEDMLKFIGEDMFIKLIKRYGDSLYLVDKYFVISDNLVEEIDNYIVSKYRDGIFFDPCHVPDFVKHKAPDLFISNDAPIELKRYFYGYGVEANLTFKVISENKDWLKYLRGKNILAMFNKSGYLKNSDLYAYYFNLFKEDGLKVALFNPSYIDCVIYKKEQIDLVYKWYLASGKKFIPSEVVIDNFPIEEASKFFKYAKWWKKLASIKRYSNSYEAKDGLLKLAYVFGVFDGNIQGFNLLYKSLNYVPREFVLNRAYGNRFPDLVDSNLIVDFLEASEKENFSLDYFEKVGHKYKLNVLNEKYPQSLEIVRVCIEKKVDGLLTPSMVHTYFSGFEMKYDEEFLNFLLKNIDKVFKERPSYVASVQKNFKRIKQLNSGRKLTWERAIDCVKNITYDNIELGNEYLASVVSMAGCTNNEFRKLQYIYNVGKCRVWSSIPRVTGNVNGFSYEILRLDNPLTLVIGTLTDCCQCIGNVAESCMVHSMTSDNGRIFVVRDSDGEIVAQSWVWRNRNVICFDNIEIPDKMFSKYENLGEQVLLAYQDAAHKLINIDNVTFRRLYEENRITKEQYDKLKLSKVTVGLGYNDIKNNIVKNLKEDTGLTSVPLEEEKNLNLYTCDSDDQYVLYMLDKDILSSEFRKDIKYYEYINNEQCSSLDNLVIYCDLYKIYNEDNFDVEMLKVLKSLEIIRDAENIIFEDSFDDIIDYYNLNEPYIIMNNNFAIIYEIESDIKLVDIFANIDSKGSVLKQIEYALKQISNDKKIDISLLNEKALSIYNQVIKNDMILKRKR